jgi:hypothetical protein
VCYTLLQKKIVDEREKLRRRDCEITKERVRLRSEVEREGEK